MSTPTIPYISERGGSRIAIEGLTPEQIEKIAGTIESGNFWFGCPEGQPTFLPSFKELPDPQTDEEMLPFWRRQSDVVATTQEYLFDEERYSDHSSPSIEIAHLCGYNYTPENYRKEAEKLTSFGFECLRSKRGLDGKYWEVWRLPFLLAAKGDFKDYLEGQRQQGDTSKVRCQRAVEFLTKQVSFGTLDICVQRMAQVIELD